MKKRKLVYVAEPQYVFDELPGYLQKRYRNGQGFLEVRPDLTREHFRYEWRPSFGHAALADDDRWIDREEEGLFIPLSDYEIRYMRRMATQAAMSEWQRAELQEEAEKEAARQRELEQRRKKRMNQYIHRYLHNTGLWYEAIRAGCSPGWIYVK